MIERRPSGIGYGDAHHASSPRATTARDGREVQQLAVEARRRAELPPHSSPALSAIASNTGCTSVGDSLMTLQDFRGRRLPLERLLGLVEQAHVLDRDHRLVGEGLEQSRSGGSRMRRSRPRVTLIVPIATPSRSSGTTTAGCESRARAPSRHAREVARIDLDVGDLRRRCRRGSCAPPGCRVERRREGRLQRFDRLRR